MYCRYCRAKNRSSAEECIVCGKPFPKKDRQEGVSISAPPQPAPAPVAPPAAAPGPVPAPAARTPEPTATRTVPQQAATPAAAGGKPDAPQAARPPAASPAATPPPGVQPLFAHVHVDPDEFARRFPEDAVRQRSIGSRITRVFLFALLWVSALALGALSARWIDNNGGVQAALKKLVPAPARHTEPPLAAEPGRSELPYDGEHGGASQPPLRATQEIDKPPVREASPPAVAGTKARQRSAPQAVAQEEKPADTSSTSSISSGSSAGATETDTTGEVATAAPPAQAKAAKPVEKAAAQPLVKSARPAKKSSATQKIARGREISRIQQQAADELKKKD